MVAANRPRYGIKNYLQRFFWGYYNPAGDQIRMLTNGSQATLDQKPCDKLNACVQFAISQAADPVGVLDDCRAGH